MPLTCGGHSSGDDANDLVILPVTVNDEQQPESGAEAEQQKALFIVARMFEIIEQQGGLILKGGGRFLEIDTVLALIRLILLGVPLEANGHSPKGNYDVCTPQGGGGAA